MKRLVLISEPKAAKRLACINDADCVIVSLNDSSSSSLRKHGITFKTISDFFTEKEAREINKQSILWLKEWSQSSRIKEITYKNISLWWFFDFWLYYSFFKWDMVKNIIWNIEASKKIIEKTKPDKILVLGNKTINYIVKQIRPDSISIVYRDLQHIMPYLIDFGVNAKHLFRKIAARILHRKNKKNDEKSKKIIFTTYTSGFRDCVREDGSIAKEDAIVGYVVRKAMQKYSVSVADIDFTTTLGIKQMLEKRRSPENIPFEYYMTIGTSISAWRDAREIKKQWKSLDDDHFRNSLDYKSINIYPLVKPWLDFVFKKRIYSAIRYMETGIQMIEKENAKLVFIVDETALFGRSMIAAARMKDIPAFAIQHGYITPDSFEYMHLKGEINNSLRIEKPFCPIADKTFIYGPYTKELLMKAGTYPAESIAMTGQPRYDCLANKGAFSKIKVYSKYGIDIRKKLVLWTTQDVAGQEEIVFNAVKNMNDVQLLVKLHPREMKAPDFYVSKARESGIDIIAVKEANTFELIKASDVMITMHSTTGLEAIMMNVPVVVLNVSGRPDMVPYVQEGVAIGVYRPEDLEKALKDALYNKKTIKKLMENSRKYAYKHSYKNDGQATKRVMGIIDKSI